MIENLTAELKLTLKKSAAGNMELIKRRRDIERLSRDNALLREESTAFILDDSEKEEVNEGSYSRNKGDALSDGLIEHLDRNEFRSRGLREEVSDLYSDPVYKEGDFVMIMRDTRPGVLNKFSYDKEGKVMQSYQ